MISFTQSPFLQALGHAIINSLWQFALLWLLYIIVTGVGNMRSHARFVTGMLLQFTGFAWFVVTLIFYYQQCAGAIGTFGLGYLDSAADSTGSFREKLFVFLLQAEQFLPYLSTAYLALLMFLSAKWMQALRYTNRVKTQGLLKMDVDWRLFVQKIAEQMGIKRPVKIFLSELVSSPLTIGFLKPVILVPLASLNHLSTQQMEAVLLHELAHIKRMDYLLNILLSIVEAVLFFNPFMQLISKQLKRERENSCDDWVLQYEYSATTYAKALLTLATVQTKIPALAMHAADNKRQLLTRVKRIIEKNERTFNYRHQLMALLLITGILSSMAWLKPAAIPSSNTTRSASNITYEPVAVKVDNPLFNPVFFFAKKEQIEKELVAAERKVSNTNSIQQVSIDIEENISKILEEPKVLSTLALLHVQETKKLPYKYLVKTGYDTSIRQDVREFLSAAFWLELERKEHEMKQSQRKLAKLQQPISGVPVGAIVIESVEESLAEMKLAKQELLNAAIKAKTARDAEAIKVHVRDFAVQSVNVKKLMNEWNKELKAVNKELEVINKIIESAKSESGIVATFASAKDRERELEAGLDHSLAAIEKAVAKAEAKHQQNCNKSTKSKSKKSETNEPVPAPANPPLDIYITEKGKVIKVVKI